MTYHDKNRLTAHIAHLKLSATELAVAKELADSLKLKTGNIQLPASYLAKQIGRTEKTTQTALRTLLELGIFTATRATSHTARIYELEISCPQNCLHLEAHNSPIRLKRLAIQAREAGKLTGNFEAQQNQLTGKKDKLTGNHYLTNRDIDIDDIEQQLFRTIETISELLNDQGELTKNQLKLKAWITSEPGSIEARVRQLAEKGNVRSLEAWLKVIIGRNPETLYRHLEQNKKTTKQAKKELEQTATIYSEIPGTNRLNKTRLTKYAKELAGFELTNITYNYLAKRGINLTWRDLQLAKYFEAIGTNTEIRAISPDNSLQLELIDNQIAVSYIDPDNSSFSFSLEHLDSWGLLTATELENHLEAERLEAELRASYTAQGKSYNTAETYGFELAEIRAKYPTITPAEKAKRYTQAFSEYLNKFYQGLPIQPIGEQPIEPLNTWLNRNYTQLSDYQELLEHYPAEPKELNNYKPWNEQAGLTAYLEALAKGYTWEKLADKADRYTASLGNSYPKHPNTWLNELPNLSELPKAKPGERAGEAKHLADILDSYTPLKQP